MRSPRWDRDTWRIGEPGSASAAGCHSSHGMNARSGCLTIWARWLLARSAGEQLTCQRDRVRTPPRLDALLVDLLTESWHAGACRSAITVARTSDAIRTIPCTASSPQAVFTPDAVRVAVGLQATIASFNTRVHCVPAKTCTWRSISPADVTDRDAADRPRWRIPWSASMEFAIRKRLCPGLRSG